MKVLLIQRRTLGDALYTGFIAEVLKKEISDVEIALLSLKPICEVFKNYKYLDACIPYDGFYKSLKEIHKFNPDVVLDYESTFRTYALVLFSNAEKRVAFYRKKRELFLYPIYNYFVRYESFNFTFWDRLKLLEIFEIDYKKYIANKYLPMLETANFSSDGDYILFTPKGKHKTKSLHPKVVKNIYENIKKYIDVKISIDPKEKDYIEQLKNLGLPVIETTISEFKELVLLSKGVITIEAFPYHLSLALRKKAFVIIQAFPPFFKETFNLLHFYYPKLECLMCKKGTCPKGNYDCTIDINVSELLKEIKNFFNI